MNWTQLITDIRSRGFTLQEIADHVGMSKGQVHDLLSGRGRSVLYDTGVKLKALHVRAMRRKVKAGHA